jgi:hypothetical protein
MTISTLLTRGRRFQAALPLDPIPASKVQSGPPEFAELDTHNYSQIQTQGWRRVVGRGGLSRKKLRPRWQAQDSYRWIRGFETRKAAGIQLRKILTSIDNETYVEPSKQNLADYLDRWLTAAKPNLAPKTFERYKQLIDVNIKPKVGAIKLAQLKPPQLVEFYTWSATFGNRRTGKGLNPQTVLHIHRLLRKALQQAVVWQLRATNPAEAVEVRESLNGRSSPLTKVALLC